MQNGTRHQGSKALLLLIAAAMLVVFAASAQIGDEDPCRTACREENARCVARCAEHDNPIECEQTCQEQAEDCEDSC